VCACSVMREGIQKIGLEHIKMDQPARSKWPL
jgi:hypothetical protein